MNSLLVVTGSCTNDRINISTIIIHMQNVNVNHRHTHLTYISEAF